MEWFRHDITMESDPKISGLIRRFGYEGLGLYCHIIPILYQKNGYVLEGELREELRDCSENGEQILEYMISRGLLQQEGFALTSRRVIKELEATTELSEKRATAGRKGGLAKSLAIANKNQANAKQLPANAKQIVAHTNIHTNIYNPPVSKDTVPPKGGNVSKKQVIPTLEEVADYCKERGNGIDPQAFIDYYASQKWKKANGQPLYDWKAGVRTWENKRKEQSTPKQRTNKMVEDLEERIRLNHSIDPRTGEPR